MTQTREQWLAERRKGIGGSDCAPALGLSKWKSPLELYLEKLGLAEGSDDSVDMLIGRMLEPELRRMYAEQTGQEVIVPGVVQYHPTHNFMLATLDGVRHDGRLVEFKTARSDDGWGEPGTDAVPQEYLLQVQHYLAVCDLEVADLAVLFKNQRKPGIAIYEIPADKELQYMLIEGEQAFWAHVQREQPPEPDFESARALEVVRRLYKGTNGQTIQATPAQEAWRTVYAEASAKAKQYSEAADHAKAHLLYEMGEAYALQFSDNKSLRRKLTSRKAYTVEATEFMEARFVNNRTSNGE